jgi:DinB superfamily
MEIEPDTKDWTWVLQRPCGECGFDTSSFPREAVSRMIRENGAAWELVLEAGGVRTRRTPTVWSPLEYGCHVRDVFRLYDYRIGLMLSQDDPLYPNWDQDETAVRDRYPEQEPSRVQAEVVEAAQGLAERIDTVTGDTWQRPGRRSDGANFTVESIARYMLHDVVHHLHDVSGS